MKIYEVTPYGITELFGMSMDDIDEAKKTGFFGKTPVVDKKEYPDSPIYFTTDPGGKCLGIVPMKSSERSMVVRYGQINWRSFRVYEYEYIFAEYLGKRVAKWMLKTGKRMFFADTSSGRWRFGASGSRVDLCFVNSFKSGFMNVLYTDYQDMALSHSIVAKLQINPGAYGVFACAWPPDSLSDGKFDSFCDLFREFLKTYRPKHKALM